MNEQSKSDAISDSQAEEHLEELILQESIVSAAGSGYIRNNSFSANER